MRQFGIVVYQSLTFRSWITTTGFFDPNQNQ